MLGNDCIFCQMIVTLCNYAPENPQVLWEVAPGLGKGVLKGSRFHQVVSRPRVLISLNVGFSGEIISMHFYAEGPKGRR